MSSYDPAALECLAAIVEEAASSAPPAPECHAVGGLAAAACSEASGLGVIVRSEPLQPTSAGQLLLKHTKQLRRRADLERDLQELAPSAPGAEAGTSVSPSPSRRQHRHLGA